MGQEAGEAPGTEKGTGEDVEGESVVIGALWAVTPKLET